MADLLDFVSLSLLPPWCWRVAADWLRQGDPPDSVVRRLLAACTRQEPGRSSAARSLAADAIRYLEVQVCSVDATGRQSVMIQRMVLHSVAQADL